MRFYSLFGLEEERRFKSGAARCAWLTGLETRVELIEVPKVLDPDLAPDGLAALAVGKPSARPLSSTDAPTLHRFESRRAGRQRRER